LWHTPWKLYVTLGQSGQNGKEKYNVFVLPLPSRTFV